MHQAMFLLNLNPAIDQGVLETRDHAEDWGKPPLFFL